MAAERSRWTDDRLDDLAERVMRQDALTTRFDVLEARFDSLERRFEDFRQEMREFRAEMREFRREITSNVRSLRSEVYTTKRWMMGLWLSGALGFAALFVQIALQN